jgi:hypothetical protein
MKTQWAVLSAFLVVATISVSVAAEETISVQAMERMCQALEQQATYDLNLEGLTVTKRGEPGSSKPGAYPSR